MIRFCRRWKYTISASLLLAVYLSATLYAIVAQPQHRVAAVVGLLAVLAAVAGLWSMRR